jgi:hypothetical protein
VFCELVRLAGVDEELSVGHGGCEGLGDLLILVAFGDVQLQADTGRPAGGPGIAPLSEWERRVAEDRAACAWPCLGERLRGQHPARVQLAALFVVRLAVSAQLDDPVMQSLPALAERLLELMNECARTRYESRAFWWVGLATQRLPRASEISARPLGRGLPLRLHRLALDLALSYQPKGEDCAGQTQKDHSQTRSRSQQHAPKGRVRHLGCESHLA